MKRLLLVSAIVSGLALGAVLAKAPVENVSAKKHPNLAAAQKLAASAYDKITAAQKANEFDLEGHAARAKELLDQVNQELKLATEAANANSPAR